MLTQVPLVVFLVLGVLTNKLFHVVHKVLHRLRLPRLHQPLHELGTHVSVKLVAAQIFLGSSDSLDLVIDSSSFLLFPQTFSLVLDLLLLSLNGLIQLPLKQFLFS